MTPRIGPAVSSTRRSAPEQAAIMVGVYVVGPLLALLTLLLVLDRMVQS